MPAESVKLEIKLNFPVFLGVSFLFHFLLALLFNNPAFQSTAQKTAPRPKKEPLIVTIGEENRKSLNTVFVEPQLPSSPSQKKNLNLSDLTVPNSLPQLKKTNPVSTRPGSLPQKPQAMAGLRYGADDFKKLANDPSLQGGADLLGSQKVALNFEVPEGKKVDELNESQLKLYGFLRRGAMKYVASLSAEIEAFELKNPHLKTPFTLSDSKQVLTGRLVYDNQGNIKQIKMVRWSNNDKLQGFFEDVLKRLDTLQNPPKELWVENGEFTVFVTLQING